MIRPADLAGEKGGNTVSGLQSEEGVLREYLSL
jgi:hypothetical protein